MYKRIFALILVLCDLAALQNRAAAQARDGWVIDLEPMWMNVKGFDQHNGDVVRSTTVLNNHSIAIVRHQNTEPIMNRMDAGVKFRGAIQYRRQGWGAGASGWSYSSENAINGTVTSLGSSGSLIFGTSSVSMWERDARSRRERFRTLRTLASRFSLERRSRKPMHSTFLRSAV